MAETECDLPSETIMKATEMLAQKYLPVCDIARCPTYCVGDTRTADNILSDTNGRVERFVKFDVGQGRSMLSFQCFDIVCKILWITQKPKFDDEGDFVFERSLSFDFVIDVCAITVSRLPVLSRTTDIIRC
jgi:hypothetical protein